MTGPATRREHDLLGEREVPADAYWGIHTLRALENFPISGQPIGADAELVTALATVKEAAAEANRELGLLEDAKAEAIRGGALHDQFVVDLIQGGAGTSTNMNANEVVANRALELLGRPRGDYRALHPNEHVNLCQSTNDVYPTALKLALIAAARRLTAAMALLREAFEAKAREHDEVVKVGRTQLQDAVPMTLGQELGAFAVMLGEDEARLEEAVLLLHEINLGATAIGTGIAAHPRFGRSARAHLARIAELPVVAADDLVEATQDAGVFVQVSGVLKRSAIKLSKVCNDLRLLSSGPRAGLGEIRLPPVQAGSSIMPGKVNPVIPEVVNQIAFEIVGNDVTVTMAAEAGQLQLNAFEPIIYRALAAGFAHLGAGCRVLAERCVAGIEADRPLLRRRVDHSLGLITALSPRIGYEAATEIARRANDSGDSVAELAVGMGLVSDEELRALLRGVR
jgi:aspartate ammonia-lyase